MKIAERSDQEDSEAGSYEWNEQDQADYEYTKLAPFWSAASDGDLEVVDRFVSEGFPVDEREEYLGYTALHYATMNRHLNVMKCLVEANADVNATATNSMRVTTYGYSPLLYAVQTGTLEMVRYLLEHGSNPLLSGARKVNPLQEAQELSKMYPNSLGRYEEKVELLQQFLVNSD